MSDPLGLPPRDELGDKPGDEFSIFAESEVSDETPPASELPDVPPGELLPEPIPHDASPSASTVHCLQCGYDLTGVPIGGICPECAAPVVPAFQAGSAPANGKAIASMVLGIVSIPLCFCYGIPTMVCAPLAIFFAWQAKREMVEARYSPSSPGMANAGMICGIVALVLALPIVGMIAFAIIRAIVG